jgi:hypothetical protein
VLLKVDRLDLAARRSTHARDSAAARAGAKVTDGGWAGLAAMVAVFAEFNSTQAAVRSSTTCARTPRASTGRSRSCAHRCSSRSPLVCAALMTWSISTMGASCSAGEAQSQIQTNSV